MSESLFSKLTRASMLRSCGDSASYSFGVIRWAVAMRSSELVGGAGVLGAGARMSARSSAGNESACLRVLRLLVSDALAASGMKRSRISMTKSSPSGPACKDSQIRRVEK